MWGTRVQALVRKIPRALEQLNPSAATTDALAPRIHTPQRRGAVHAVTRESPYPAMKVQEKPEKNHCMKIKVLVLKKTNA